MPKFAANLSMMYQEHAFLDRFSAAARDGFQGVECMFPYAFAVEEIKAQLDAHGLTLVLFNCPPGDWEGGERGIASLPGREQEFRQSMQQAFTYALALGKPLLHVMAGLLKPGQDANHHLATYLQNLKWAAAEAARHGLTLVIEAINLRDMPFYMLNRQGDAHTICAEIGAPNLRVQFDMYHCQIVEGDLAHTMQRDLAGIAHMQIAGVPGRNEPDSGEIHYPYLFGQMDALGYSGWVGCEYRPKAGTSAGLGWLKSWLEKTSSKGSGAE
jgi:hydroxypyruvate isomerase